MTERTSNPQLMQELQFSLNSLRHSQQQEEQPKKKRQPKKSYMHMRRLSDLEISVHNRPNCRSFTFSQFIAERLYNEGMEYVNMEYSNGKFLMTFIRLKKEGYAKLTYNLQGRRPSATFYRKAFVEDLCNYFGEGQGNYYVETSDIYTYTDRIEIYCQQINERQPLDSGAQPIKKTCPKCKRTLPMSEFYVMTDRPDGHSSYCKECNRAHGRLRNGTTGEYRADPTISQATDKQLYDELKRRGYNGKLTKMSTLE